MFFIVPPAPPETTAPTAPSQPAPSRGVQQQTSSAGDVEAYYRRRVAAACDRCRLKKARCSGGPAPCSKCKRDRVICIISKDKKLDTQPKPPEYVRMVESQRDLLLKAVHELRQKCTACEQTGVSWDAASEINHVLQELGVHEHHSEVVRETILEELHSPRLKPDRTKVKQPPPLSNLPEGLDSSTFNHLNEINHPSTSSGSSDFDRMFPIDQHFNDTLFAANTEMDDSPPFDENMLISDWPPPPSSLPLFNFQEPADLDYLNLQPLQQQTWSSDGSPHNQMPAFQ